MPYSKKLGFIHIAIPKTGSTSLIRALKTISTSHGGLELYKKDIDSTYREKYNLHEIRGRKAIREKHLSAIQIKYILGQQEFDRCTKFSLVRNPWARVLSRYYFTHTSREPTAKQKARQGTKRKFHDMEFETWIKRVWKRHNSGKPMGSQLSKLIDLDGELIVDHVGRLENAQITLDWLTDKLSVKKVEMPHVNSTRHRHYSEFYNPTTSDMVGEMCKTDIDYFGYSFEA